MGGATEPTLREAHVAAASPPLARRNDVSRSLNWFLLEFRLGLDGASTSHLQALDLYWKSIDWIANGPRLDLAWTSPGLAWASPGHLLDLIWTSTGPRLDLCWP